MANSKYTQPVVLVAPFINLKKGLVIEGIIQGRGTSIMDDGKPSKSLDVILASDFVNPPKPKEAGAKEVKFKKGDLLRLSLKAGNQRMYELPIGTEFMLTVLGQVASKKGNDAWTFELATAPLANAAE